MGRDARHLGAGAVMMAVMIGLAGCPNSDAVVPTRPKPVDAGTPADCHAACERMRELDCPEAKPDEQGSSCEKLCEHVEASGTVTLDPVCVAQIKDCSGIDRCTY